MSLQATKQDIGVYQDTGNGNGLISNPYHSTISLSIKQEPIKSKVNNLKNTANKPNSRRKTAKKRFVQNAARFRLDPRAIVAINCVSATPEQQRSTLIGPTYLVTVTLENVDNPNEDCNGLLVGNRSMSPYFIENEESRCFSAFCFFEDLSVKREGRFRLVFTLRVLEFLNSPVGELSECVTARSSAFVVYPNKSFPGLSANTLLEKYLQSKGVKALSRAESKAAEMLRKRVELSEGNDERRRNQAQSVATAGGPGQQLPDLPIGDIMAKYPPRGILNLQPHHEYNNGSALNQASQISGHRNDYTTPAAGFLAPGSDTHGDNLPTTVSMRMLQYFNPET
ncbi:hypothetical protein CkaCkLH20_11650 [Colletotrichum karsti]|uniref:Velvet domain-containing protein n=1 Tax=Colletotrichum karsti TaxID=1095194 RepID=A0A9P6HUI1_9PEZI|nr:uncharacterized protein CkaCkLH20_11650 [Colletotrichum karsti]KAF9870978.1 hypothetical protein CkaCkLH20_11650 [Colletotrichum karsti]